MFQLHFQIPIFQPWYSNLPFIPAFAAMDDLQNYGTPGKLERDEFLGRLKALFQQIVASFPQWPGSFNQLLTDGFDDDQIWAMISITNDELLALVEASCSVDRLAVDVKTGSQLVSLDIAKGVGHQQESDCELSDVDGSTFATDEADKPFDQYEDDLEGDLDDESDAEFESADFEPVDEQDDDPIEEFDDPIEEFDDPIEEFDDEVAEFDNPLEHDAEDSMDELVDDVDECQDELQKDVYDVKYDDFFDENAPEFLSDDGEEFNHDLSQSNTRTLDLDSEEEVDPTNLSTFERTQQRLKKEISDLEKENVASEKPWTLRGEITAAKRPLDSLLEVDVDFDNNAKPVPVITQEYCDNLDQVIMQRIKDGMFDDVERRKPVILNDQSIAPVELDMEKSSKGLAQIYEEQYLNAGNAQSALNKPEHAEIKTLFASLMNRLDALSNYHFTPKVPRQEIQIVSNISAMAVEEPTPAAVSTESMIRPVEVFQGKMPIAYGEYSKSKKRRVAKASARRKQDIVDAKSSDKQKAIQQLSKQRNVIVKKRTPKRDSK